MFPRGTIFRVTCLWRQLSVFVYAAAMFSVMCSYNTSKPEQYCMQSLYVMHAIAISDIYCSRCSVWSVICGRDLPRWFCWVIIIISVAVTYVFTYVTTYTSGFYSARYCVSVDHIVTLSTDISVKYIWVIYAYSLIIQLVLYYIMSVDVNGNL